MNALKTVFEILLYVYDFFRIQMKKSLGSGEKNR